MVFNLKNNTVFILLITNRLHSLPPSLWVGLVRQGKPSGGISCRGLPYPTQQPAVNTKKAERVSLLTRSAFDAQTASRHQKNGFRRSVSPSMAAFPVVKYPSPELSPCPVRPQTWPYAQSHTYPPADCWGSGGWRGCSPAPSHCTCGVPR